ncbi:MAG: hypothetical protein HS099_12155 [Ardenticatenaceae bacterium]|nr:hypothetical protein [Ardenticatenaceae bacterium]
MRLRGWHDLHMRQDADTSFTAIYVEVRLEREKRPQPIWLAYLGATAHTVREAWLWFDHRWPIETEHSLSQAEVVLDLPNLQASTRCDCWTWLVEAAFWQLYLARV